MEPIKLENVGRGERFHGLRLPCVSEFGRDFSEI
jgi:hypothetical protein